MTFHNKATKHDDVFDARYEDFDASVIQPSHLTPVLVDLWAEWCSPCIVIAPVLQSLITEYSGRIRLARVEVDEGENMKLAGHYRVKGFPTVILFSHGEEQARFHGARPLHFLREFVAPFVDNS
jgi:putative thioredoxin